MRSNDFATLQALIASCASAGVTRQALLLRADRLPSSLSRPHHLRLAEAALAPLTAVSRVQFFHLPGPRYAVTWRGDADAAVLEVVDSLGHLLEDAPLSMPPLRDLLFLFDLPQHAGLLLDACAEADLAEAAPSLPVPPIDAVGLAALEANLAQADVARFVRRRPVWEMGRAGLALAWEKRTISVGELAAEMLPGKDVHADPWLFRRLTRTLDRRMLSLLTHPGVLTRAAPFSLDLNVASLLSPEFLRFDIALPARLRRRVVIELMPADVMADVPAFVFARSFARVRGYRLLLRNVTQELAALLSLPALDLDYLQHDWVSGQTHDGLPPGCTSSLTLLSGVVDPESLNWGRRHGVRLFQGSAADGLALGERVTAA